MKVVLTIGILLWLTAVGYGVVYLSRYEATPGEPGRAQTAGFPPSSRIKPAEGKATLLFFAHPKCPCSRAGLAEIGKIMAEVNGRLDVYVVLSKPAGAPDDWTKTGLRESAEKMPGVTVVVDEDDVETELFDAKTSGTALLYDVAGNLRFRGGVTRVRGQEGDNAGRSAIADIVNNNFSENENTAIYGCPIRDVRDDRQVTSEK